eukprot:2973495-Amphidinium_carterae.2
MLTDTQHIFPSPIERTVRSHRPARLHRICARCQMTHLPSAPRGTWLPPQPQGIPPAPPVQLLLEAAVIAQQLATAARAY